MLSKHPMVEQCAVVLHERTEQDKRLVAYMTLVNGKIAEPSEIRDFLRKELTDYMIPASFQVIDRMPLTDNGKIARDKLPAPVFDSSKKTAARLHPEQETEMKVMLLWQELLGMSDIGIDDNFFDVGGNSLLAIKATSLINQQFNAGLSVAQFFQYPTIAALGAHLDNRGKDNGSERTKERAQLRLDALKRRKQMSRLRG